MKSFESILSEYHVYLEDTRRDESIKLAAEKYANQDKWISVEDELPKKDGNSSIFCLVNDKYNGVVVRPFNEYHNCWDDEDADDYYTDAKGGKITHWQPLPNPPKQ